MKLLERGSWIKIGSLNPIVFQLSIFLLVASTALLSFAMSEQDLNSKLINITEQTKSLEEQMKNTLDRLKTFTEKNKPVILENGTLDKKVFENTLNQIISFYYEIAGRMNEGRISNGISLQIAELQKNLEQLKVENVRSLKVQKTDLKTRLLNLMNKSTSMELLLEDLILDDEFKPNKYCERVRPEILMNAEQLVKGATSNGFILQDMQEVSGLALSLLTTLCGEVKAAKKR